MTVIETVRANSSSIERLMSPPSARPSGENVMLVAGPLIVRFGRAAQTRITPPGLVTIQPPAQSVLSVQASAPAHTVMGRRCLIASDRASCMAESTSFAAVVTRLLRIMLTKDGAAIVATMAMIATVTIISIRVKPLLCVRFIEAKP